MAAFLYTAFLGFFIALARRVIRKSGPGSVLEPSKESVFITGCDSGIGYQCALHFDCMGFRVFAGCLSANGQGAQELLKGSTNVEIVQLDVTDEESVKAAYQTITDCTKNNGLWALLNNAGVMCYGKFEWYTWNQCQKQIDVNFTGTIRVTKTFLPLIMKRKGRIVTMSSVNGRMAYPAQSVYCATKFALEGFCDSLRHEVLKSGVSVISIRLGDFARLTNIFAQHDNDVREMWAHMDEENRQRQGDYFWHFHKLAAKKHGLTSPPSFQQSRLFSDVRHAVMAAKPRSRYQCMSVLQRIVLWLFLVMPTSVSDFLLGYIFTKVVESGLE